VVNINIEIPDDVHKKIRIISAVKGNPIKDIVLNALEESIHGK